MARVQLPGLGLDVDFEKAIWTPMGGRTASPKHVYASISPDVGFKTAAVKGDFDPPLSTAAS